MSAVSAYAGATMAPRARGIKRLARATVLGLTVAALAACGNMNARAPVASAPAPISGPLDRLGRPIEGNTVQVGLLLPLSGSSAETGRAMQRAAEMAILESGATNVQLIVRDSGEAGPSAGTAAGQVIAEGADIILGPLFSPSIPAVASAAATAGINVISFSTDTSRVVGSNNVFLFSFLPEQHVRRIVEYASSRGLKRIAVVAPSTAYGQVIVSAAQSAAGQFGAQIVTTQMFDQSLSNPQDMVNAIKASQPDAILVAAINQSLNVLAPSITGSGLTAQMLGTGQWDTPDRGAQSALVGAWYAAPDPQSGLRRDFEDHYLANFGSRPPRLATLAYDATWLAIKLGSRGTGMGLPFSAAALEDPNGFQGVDGIFRFGSNRLVERGLAVLQIQADGTTTVIDPAAQSFTGPIF